jgi:hypothetical protein
MSKSPKQLPILTKKSRNGRRSNHFQWCPLSRLHLYCYRFLLFIQLGTTKALLFNSFINTQNHTIAE